MLFTRPMALTKAATALIIIYKKEVQTPLPLNCKKLTTFKKKFWKDVDRIGACLYNNHCYGEER